MIALDTLRAAFEAPWDTWHGPRPYDPASDALLRRVAKQLPDHLLDDVAELIRLARRAP